MTKKENSPTLTKSQFTFSMTPANGRLPLRGEEGGVESHKLETEQVAEEAIDSMLDTHINRNPVPGP